MTNLEAVNIVVRLPKNSQNRENFSENRDKFYWNRENRDSQTTLQCTLDNLSGFLFHLNFL